MYKIYINNILIVLVKNVKMEPKIQKAKRVCVIKYIYYIYVISSLAREVFRGGGA